MVAVQHMTNCNARTKTSKRDQRSSSPIAANAALLYVNKHERPRRRKPDVADSVCSACSHCSVIAEGGSGASYRQRARVRAFDPLCRPPLVHDFVFDRFSSTPRMSLRNWACAAAMLSVFS